MKKTRLRKGRIAIALILFLMIITVAVGLIWYNTGLTPVSKNTNNKVFVVNKGESYVTISKNLKEQNLIKSETIFQLYVRLNKKNNLKAGTYHLNESMSVEEIIEILINNDTVNPKITFIEGYNMRKVIEIIQNNTDNTEQEIKEVLASTNYLQELINKYWFLTEEILNEQIYYPLEGYLFPDTYEIKGRESTVEEILEKMLDQTAIILEPLKEDIENSEYTVHEILTMASIIELEAANSNDRKGIAGVFYNRLNDNWSLGSDVTTYYAIQVDINERGLLQSELDDYNAYNTRCTQMRGKLPVGPICNPSLGSIEAALNPTEHNDFYFIADKTGKTYFSETSKEHEEIKTQLKADGLWYTHE